MWLNQKFRVGGVPQEMLKMDCIAKLNASSDGPTLSEKQGQQLSLPATEIKFSLNTLCFFSMLFHGLTGSPKNRRMAVLAQSIGEIRGDASFLQKGSVVREVNQ